MVNVGLEPDRTLTDGQHFMIVLCQLLENAQPTISIP